MPRSRPPRIALAALLLGPALLSPALLAGSLTVPGLANAPGKNGARFETALTVLNAGPTEAAVRFGLVPAQGTTAPAEVERRLGAGETLVLGNALRDLFGLDGTFGTLTVTSTSPLVANGATRNVASAAGTYGVGLTPVAAGEELSAGEPGHAAWLSHTGEAAPGSRANVTVALLDPKSGATLEVRDAGGALVAAVPLASEAPVTWQASLSDLVAGRIVEAGRAVLIPTAGRATGYVSVVDNATGDGLLSPFVRAPEGETDLVVNGVARTPGERGTRWTTGLRLANPGPEPLLVFVDAVGVAPAPPRWRVERTVAPGGVLGEEDLLLPFGAVEGSAGAARIRAPGPLLVLAATTTPDPTGGSGRFGVTQPGVPFRGGLLGAGDAATLSGLVHGAGFRANVAFLAGPEGAEATLTLRDAAGSVLGGEDAGLVGSEWRQRSLPEWTGVAAVPAGSRLDVLVSRGTLDAVATVVDDGTGDAVALRAAPLPAACEGAAAPGSPAPGTTLALGPPAGTIRPLLGVNIGPIPAGEATADLTEAYHEAGVTSIRTHDYYGPLDMATLYPSQAADPESPASYDFAASDAVFARIVAGGFEPLLRLGDSYSAAVGYPPAVPRRPTNPDGWVAAAVEVVRHYDDASRWGGRPLRYVEIWNEPDNGRFWDGTQQEFFALFSKAARALKAAFPHLLVGGPGFAPSGALAPQGQAMTRGLLDRLRADGVAIDFLSWHSYSNEPETVRSMARFYRSELDARGFASVPTVIDEWNTETRNASPEDALALRAGGRGASILTATWVVLQEEGIVEASVYRGPDPSMNAPQFYGLFYADARPKRTGLALGLWKRLADHPERLALSASRADGTPALYALAGRSGSGEVALLVANPSSTATSVRLALPGGSAPSCLRVTEVSDASDAGIARTVAGDTAAVPAYATLLLVPVP